MVLAATEEARRRSAAAALRRLRRLRRGGRRRRRDQPADVFAAIEDYLERTPTSRAKVGKTFLFKLTDPASAWTARPQERQGQRSPPARRQGRLHARARRRRLPRHDERQGRRDEALHGRQAQDQRQRDGVAEARVPEEDRSEAGDGGRRRSARRRGAGRCGAEGSGRGSGGRAKAARRRRRRSSRRSASASRRTRASRRRSARSSSSTSTSPTRAGSSTSTGAGAVREGTEPKATTVLTIDDDDLAALAKGTVAAQSLYQHGKLRVDGDVRRRAPPRLPQGPLI